MGLGYTLDMWYRVRPVLAQHYRVILFDNRGVGRSDVPKGPYSIRAMAGDAIAVLDAARVGTCHVFGLSMGGMTAQELALSYPQRVRSLILGCTHCGGTQAVPASQKVLDVLMARGSMPPDEGVLAMVPYIYDPSTPKDRVEQDLEIRRRTYPSETAYVAQVRAIINWGSYERLPQLTVPTLVIHGESDQLVPPENGKLLANTIPGARLVMLPSASHVFITDQPEAASKVVLHFLDQQKSSGALTVSQQQLKTNDER
jgi:pimeloyl-ACP methyl ester carboxylesterase